MVSTKPGAIHKLSMVTAIAAASLGMTQAQAAEYNFTFAHVLIEETPNAQAALKFKEVVEEKSDGRISIVVLPAAQVGGDVEIIEQIQLGLVDIGIPPTATLGNFEPRMQILDLPFLGFWGLSVLKRHNPLQPLSTVASRGVLTFS